MSQLQLTILMKAQFGLVVNVAFRTNCAQWDGINLIQSSVVSTQQVVLLNVQLKPQMRLHRFYNREL